MINLYRFLDQQSTEDTRALIIHFPADSGKTAFAIKAAAERSGIYYLDLQEIFLKLPDLPPISQCGFNYLKDFLLRLQTADEFIIVDNADFLLNTWKIDDKRDLLQWIKVQLRSPGVTDKTFIFIIQTDDVLVTEHFNNSRGQSRVLLLNEFEAL